MLAVIVPVYRPSLVDFERISWDSISKKLRHHQIIWVGPESLPNDSFARSSGFQFVGFPSAHFSSRVSYSRLLMSRRFYATFAEFSHILIAQLDSLVLSGNIEAWMRSGLDFVGSPLRSGYGLTSETGYGPGLNGGLSLRRTDSALRVLTSSRTRRIALRPAFRMESRLARRVVRTVRDGLLFNYSSWPARVRLPRINEDLYWSCLVPATHPWFSVPEPSRARTFAVDASNGWEQEHYRQLCDLVGIHAFQKLPASVIGEIGSTRAQDKVGRRRPSSVQGHGPNFLRWPWGGVMS